jgi:hypothetical protein
VRERYIRRSIGIGSALAVVSTADVLRFMSRRIERRYESLLGFLMRESEKVRSRASVLTAG